MAGAPCSLHTNTGATQYLHTMLNHMGKKPTWPDSEANTSTPNIFICKRGSQYHRRGFTGTVLFHECLCIPYHYIHTSPRALAVPSEGSTSPSDSEVHQ